MGLAVYLDYNICIWRRESTTTSNLTLYCVFSAPNSIRQIHVLLDARTKTVRDQSAHFSLITQFAFKDRATRTVLGATGPRRTTGDWFPPPSTLQLNLRGPRDEGTSKRFPPPNNLLPLRNHQLCLPKVRPHLAVFATDVQRRTANLFRASLLFKQNGRCVWIVMTRRRHGNRTFF